MPGSPLNTMLAGRPASARCSSVRNSASSASQPTSSGARAWTRHARWPEARVQPATDSRVDAPSRQGRASSSASRSSWMHEASAVAYHPARPDRTKICSLLTIAGSAERQQYLDRLRRDAASAGRAQQLTAVGIELRSRRNLCEHGTVLGDNTSGSAGVSHIQGSRVQTPCAEGAAGLVPRAACTPGST